MSKDTDVIFETLYSSTLDRGIVIVIFKFYTTIANDERELIAIGSIR